MVIANLVGSVLARKAQKKADKKNRKAVRQASKQAQKWTVENYSRELKHRREDYATVRKDQLQDRATQFVRLREAAEAGGFNPLSVIGADMLPNGGIGGAGHAPISAMAHQSAPPLASIEMLTEGFKGLTDQLTGQAALDRAEQKARIDLARVEAERLSGMPIIGNPATPGGGGRRTPSLTPGPSVMTSAPGMAVPANFGSGPFDDPVLVDGNDRLTRANPDSPVQPEEDLWGWWRDGSFFPNIGETVVRNYEGFAEFTSAPIRTVAGGAFNSTRERWGEMWRTGPVRYFAPSLQQPAPGTGPKPSWLP